MSSPSASRVVRRRSVKSRFGVSLQIGANRMSRQLDVRVKMTVLRSLVATSFAPSNVSEATSIESRGSGDDAAVWARAMNGVATSSDAARTKARSGRRRTDTIDGSARGAGWTVNAKNGPKEGATDGREDGGRKQGRA